MWQPCLVLDKPVQKTGLSERYCPMRSAAHLRPKIRISHKREWLSRIDNHILRTGTFIPKSYRVRFRKQSLRIWDWAYKSLHHASFKVLGNRARVGPDICPCSIALEKGGKSEPGAGLCAKLFGTRRAQSRDEEKKKTVGYSLS
jgi:hypothetical protein